MTNRINLDDPDYDQNQVTIQDNKAKKLWVVLGAIALIVIVVAFLLKPAGDGSNKLNGTYMAQTAFGLNGIIFSDDGSFSRYSNISFEYGDWGLIASGTYSLRGSSLTLYCSDGKSWEFYYDSANDTMTQAGTSDVYYWQIT